MPVRTVGRVFHGGQSEGIDEHTRTTVRFIATDPQKQNIPWVEATRADGTVVVYEDASAKLDQAASMSAWPTAGWTPGFPTSRRAPSNC